ncbi:MAG: helix-turn-helix domain-containing protein [Bacteroidia bacterium]|jgi:hypothetical protein
MKVLLLEGDNVYEQLMKDFKKLLKETVKEVIIEFQDKPSQKGPKWVSSIEAMEILGCKKDKLNQLRKCNSLKSSQHGRKIRYCKKSIYDFLEKHIH